MEETAETTTTEAVDTTSTETTESTETTTTETEQTESTSEETTETEATEAGATAGEETETEGETTDATSTGKALKDTQAWGTKLSQDNADMRRTIEALQKTPRIVTPELAKKLAAMPQAAKAVGEVHGEEVGKVFEEYGNIITEMAQGIAMFEAETDKAHYATGLAELGHGNYAQVMMTDEFKAWHGTQAPMIQAGAFSGNPADVAGVLDMFKKSGKEAAAIVERQTLRDKGKVKKEATKAPGTGSVPPKTVTTFTREEVAAMSPAEYDKNRKAILSQHF